MWNKTVLTVMLQWDYGQASRGVSIEKSSFFSAMQQLVQRVEPLWFDEYLTDPVPLQELVLSRAKEMQPDLIFFIPYSDQFTVETLDSLKNISPTYCWFGDDQWRFDSFSVRYAPHFTYISTTDPWSIPKYRSIGLEPILTQWAGHPFSEVRGALPGTQEFAHDVSFVGARTKYRTWFVQRLAKCGIHVACFGAGWPNGRIDNVSMEQIFRTSRINLNISNSISHDVRFVLSSPRNLSHYLCSPKRVEQVKARNFEIPLAGGFQLTNYVPCLERYLRIGEEVAIYSTPEDCISQIQHYLAADEEREQIARSGNRRAEDEHTYEHRLADIFTQIWGSTQTDLRSGQ